MAKFKAGKGDFIFDFFSYGVLFTAILLVLYPLYFIAIASFSDPGSVYNGKVWLLPDKITLDGYLRIFGDSSIWLGYRNSLFYLVVGTSINLLFTLPAAYSLSRKNLDGRNIFMMFITLTMFFSGGLIPTYILVLKLGIRDTVWAMMLPNAVSVWNLIVARSFFQTTIPDELHEASEIDGCSNLRFFLRIVLPLSQSLVAIMILFYGIGHWNSFFNALIYLKSEELFPLQLILRSILIQNEVSEQMVTDVTTMAAQQKIADQIKYGMIVVASLPMMVLYPFLQKYFVKGVMIGSIKG